MDLRALVAFDRRLGEDRERALVEVSAEALQTTFVSAVAVVVIWKTGSRPAASFSGECADPFGHTDDSSAFTLAGLRARLASHDIAVLQSAGLGDDPDQDGFILIGWYQGSQAADRCANGEAVALAARLLRAAVARHDLEDRLEAGRQSIVELEEQLTGTGHLYMLGEMASGVAHDFNNSLTTILGTTEWLLQSESIPDDAREDLTHIRTAATDAAAYASRLQLAAHQIPAYAGRLTHSPDDASVQTFRTEAVDLSSIALHMRALSRPRWSRLVDQGLPMEVVVDAPPVSKVRGHAPEIRALLLNLVFNAIDAMEETGGRLTLRVRETDGKVHLSVSDQGTGIPDDIRPRIFEPFFTTKGTRGSGLGLSMCERIAHQHGGVLTAESEIGKGSTLTLTLPASADQALPPVDAERAQLPADTQPIARRVLLIDDQPDVRESVSDMLKALGHDVTVAADGQSGLRLVEDGEFDVVLTDLKMPGIDGLEVAKRVRAGHPNLPVILLTGWGTLFENAEPEAVSMVLPKPPTLHSLSEAITRASDIAA